MTSGRIVAAVLAVASLIGCATRHPPLDKCKGHIESARLAADAQSPEVARLCRERQAGLHVLLLSGGARNGAWGAGVLNGWGKDSHPPRPDRFDVVTGVSTGALMATHAFLGDYAWLADVYTHVSDKDIYRNRNLIYAVLLSDSLKSTKPLRKTLRRLLTDDIIKNVAGEFATGRRLYVATVNVDCGKLEIWDMVDVARQCVREGKYERYREILLASATIPIAFPPVEIDGFLHVDGGLREQVFLRKALLPIFDKWQETREKRIQTLELVSPERALVSRLARPRHRLYVLINSGLGVDCEAVPDRFADLALRYVGIASDEILLGNLHDIYSQFAQPTWSRKDKDWSDPLMSFYLCYIKDRNLLAGGSENFDQKKMQEIFEAGRAWAAKEWWGTSVPPQPFLGPDE